ncbi:MAG: phospholipase D-like domain-containing protein [Pseudomonadota bacterium]
MDIDWRSLILTFANDWWPQLVAMSGAVAAIAATAHLALTKRNVQARAGWVAIVWLAPVIGVLLYLLFGVNRIRRRAVSLHRRKSRPMVPASVVPVAGGDLPASLQTIHRMINQVTRRPLLAGNRVTVFDSGEQAWQEMLAAIAGARSTITLCTYIFDNDELGRRVVAALAAAQARGVQVRVLVDAVGLRYSWLNPVDRELEAAGIRVARFLPPRFLPWHLPYANLRNHRKILVVDGERGFTGGMNVRSGHVLPSRDPAAILDLHFELQGPVVGHLQRTFQEDWLFAAGELLSGEAWFPVVPPAGDTLARGISDGPDEDADRLLWSYLAGVQCAQKSLYVLTPYFLPEPELVVALKAAAMRGVEVTVVLPEHSNLPPVDWAATAILEDLLANGCRICLTPPPFDHGKLLLVDDAWSLVGSGNWDPRSLRLNFELVVECYDPALGRRLRYVFEQRLARARPLSLAELQTRPLLLRLRDGLAGLFTPYL